MLQVKNFSKKFGSKTAVLELSLTLKSGELVSLIGPNGSGKTTLIKSVVGLLKPSSGEILVNNIDVTKEPIQTKSMIGYIPDEPTLWQGLTGEEFLHFVGASFGIAPQDRLKKILELLKIFNVENIKQEYFEDYSRGGKQKFAILAALLHQPQLLLVDEPLVGLDPDSAETAKNLFKNFAKKTNQAVLLVTHTLAVAQEISDRIGLLSHGKLLAFGTMDELRQKAGLANNASLLEVYHKFNPHHDFSE